MPRSVIEKCSMITKLFWGQGRPLQDPLPKRLRLRNCQLRPLIGSSRIGSRQNWNSADAYAFHKKGRANVTSILPARSLSQLRRMLHGCVVADGLNWNSLRMPKLVAGSAKSSVISVRFNELSSYYVG